MNPYRQKIGLKISCDSPFKSVWKRSSPLLELSADGNRSLALRLHSAYVGISNYLNSSFNVFKGIVV
jgi:hypothetical protein